MGYKNWRTPHDEGSVYAALNRELNFTLDAAASHMNALLPRYCTEEGKFIRGDTMPEGAIFTPDGFVLDGKVIWPGVPTKISDADGLDPAAWADESVFCNPPYDDILPWAKVANARVAKVSALLILPSIDTEWFDALWVPHPEGKDKMVVVTRDTPDYHAILWQDVDRNGIYKNREIRFMRKRIRFLRPKRILSAPGEKPVVYDESDPESVPGDSPRSGNLVVITYGKR